MFLHLTTFLLLAVHVAGLTNPKIGELLRREKAKLRRPMSIAQREAAGIQPRHWRPILDSRASANEPNSISGPDVGQVANLPIPHRGGLGGAFTTVDTNQQIDAQNPDNVASVPTDAGTVPNLKWSFSLSHNKLFNGGFFREQTVTDLPASDDIAAAELRLQPNAYREMHWHVFAEWAIVLAGSGRISAIDDDGRSFVSDLIGPTNGTDPDIYYFPPGVPHSIQALEDGLELLCIFADANIDALGSTFQLSDWLVHTPPEIVTQNFGLDFFNNIPKFDPFVLPATVPPPPEGQGNKSAPVSPLGVVPSPYVFRMIHQPREVAPGGGGYLKVQDSVSNFPVATEVASAYIHIEPNGMRELHWHNNNEWIYVIQGHGRATAFGGLATARTFDMQVGDTAVIPASFGHYIKNLSPTEPFVFIEVFRSPKFIDFSAISWMALTPPQVVSDLLNISVKDVEKFPKIKPVIIG